MATNEHSGHPMKWFKDQNSARSSFECPICLEVLKDPVQVRDCGHQFCELCMDDILKTDARCPSCRIVLSQAMVFKDYAANRLIRKLEVNCCSHECSWTGSLSTYLEEHMNWCNSIAHSGNNDNANVKKLEKQVASLVAEFSSLKLQRKNIEGQMKELQTKHENEIKEIKNKQVQHENDLKEVKVQHENAIREMRMKHENVLREVRFKHENDMRNERLKHEDDVQELKEKISALQTVSFCPGTYIMKISDFNAKLSQAKFTHDYGAVFGDPFFSSSYGYKMRLMVNLNEAPSGYSGYIGVYVCLMRSDHDGILSWPFDKVFTFTVIDQNPDPWCRQDHSETLVPEGEEAFHRPKEDEESGGCGFRQFILHSKLRSRNYIMNDVVFIEVVVQS